LRISRLSWRLKRIFLKKNVIDFFHADSSSCEGGRKGGREGGRANKREEKETLPLDLGRRTREGGREGGRVGEGGGEDKAGPTCVTSFRAR